MSPFSDETEEATAKTNKWCGIDSFPQVILRQVASKAGVICLVSFLAAGCAHAVGHDPIALQAGRLTRIHHAGHLADWDMDWAALIFEMARPGKGESHRNPQHDLRCIRTSGSVMHLFPTLHTLLMPQH